ncbi:UDP-4-amino-4,6-dideoxy-N-acetyl-beta-L-altrosamine N-acetyltransferase [uncultured Helicobacter sp.]|uniref:UDP-4-amino-4, 6-dideoxy-N-acetyl-beta-L-altrosamine N-acetyltransferase n=1 Tax=uncultured Helicobacter sp. TaxID=175537 RepID=UPI00261A3B28|nr:UDP-4-amino-4,6-dideoxy-N-acetyl-beta-L-altrosamine N-acetyltransferase [uncultured Helicobacter sp.]
MRIDIFCESGAKFGLGHFYRCVKILALCLKAKQVQTITLHNRGDFTPPPLKSLLGIEADSISIEYKHYEWLSAQPEMLDLAIIDSYEAEEWFYYLLKSHSKALICLDDTLQDIYPPQSYILNPTPHSNAHFSSSHYHLWCGKDYMIPPIMPPINPPQASHTHYNVFVSFGGVDSENLTQELVNQLSTLASSQNFASYHFHIVLGNGYTHNLHIPHNSGGENIPKISIYNHLLPLYFLSKAQECDYAISAGGGSMLELIALKIPSIIIESAPNQHLHITQWEQEGAIATAHNPLEALTLLQLWHTNPCQDSHTNSLSAIKSTLANLSLNNLLPQALYELITQIALTQDSTQITAQSPIAKPSLSPSPSLKAISFTDLTETESCLVLSMRNHPQVAQWMYSTHISADSHTTFLAQLRNDNSRRYWLVKQDGEYIGVGSLTRINLVHKHAFIGIYASPFCEVKGKGASILAFLESFAFNKLELHTLHLEVLECNENAIRFYQKCGYTKEGKLHHFMTHKQRPQKPYYDVILMYKERL